MWKILFAIQFCDDGLLFLSITIYKYIDNQQIDTHIHHWFRFDRMWHTQVHISHSKYRCFYGFPTMIQTAFLHRFNIILITM